MILLKQWRQFNKYVDMCEKDYGENSRVKELILLSDESNIKHGRWLGTDLGSLYDVISALEELIHLREKMIPKRTVENCLNWLLKLDDKHKK